MFVTVPYELASSMASGVAATLVQTQTMTADEILTASSGLLTSTGILPVVFAGAVAAVLGLLIRAVKKAAR